MIADCADRRRGPASPGLEGEEKRIDSKNFSVAQPLQGEYSFGEQGFVMFSRRDNMQIIANQPKAGTPEAIVGWDHLLGGDPLAHSPGYSCGLRPSRKLGNPENSA
ncbi:hypothetical protein [Sorangium cellulosum]|uniref:hypothetical protein n=1 Tax=Sorangium cellulosum TaxID=56 RepID=UPI0011DD4589|nr:hypothetical protein [Sorangium cellulosum]